MDSLAAFPITNGGFYITHYLPIYSLWFIFVCVLFYTVAGLELMNCSWFCNDSPVLASYTLGFIDVNSPTWLLIHNFSIIKCIRYSFTFILSSLPHGPFLLCVLTQHFPRIAACSDKICKIIKAKDTVWEETQEGWIEEMEGAIMQWYTLFQWNQNRN